MSYCLCTGQYANAGRHSVGRRIRVKSPLHSVGDRFVLVFLVKLLASLDDTFGFFSCGKQEVMISGERERKEPQRRKQTDKPVMLLFSFSSHSLPLFSLEELNLSMKNQISPPFSRCLFFVSFAVFMQREVGR